MDSNLKKFLEKWESYTFFGEKRSYTISDKLVSENEFLIELKIQYKVNIENLSTNIIETKIIPTFNQSRVHEGLNPNGDLYVVFEASKSLSNKFFEEVKRKFDEMHQELFPDGFF